MENFYNSHIIKLRDVLWVRDSSAIVKALDTCRGSQIIARAEQPPRPKQELALRDYDLKTALLRADIDLDAPFILEIITRDPVAQRAIDDALGGNHGFVDKADENTLHWGGNRGEGHVMEHPVRNAPMFFRDNGMNYDMVDL